MGKIYTLKKSFPLVLAVLLSGGIIFFAVNYEGFSSKKTINEEQVLSNENWLESLKVVTTSATSTFATVQRGLMGVDTATSTTDKVGRDLLMEYALTQKAKSGEILTDSEVKIITSKLLQTAQEKPQIPYTIDDITIVKNSLQSSDFYTQRLNSILKEFYTGYAMNETIFVVKALNDQDPSVLEPLAQRITRYKNLEEDLISLKTPQDLAPLHFELLVAYTSTRITIEGMYGIFKDPVRGLMLFLNTTKR
jgi:hypothetical protein